MQPYTFASTEAMAALRAAFDASGDETYDTRMVVWGTDFAALTLALAAHANAHPDTDTAATARDLLIGVAEVLYLPHSAATDATVLLDAARISSGTYVGAWDRDQFIAVTEALREHWENGPESKIDAAGSLLGAIAETLGVEFI